VYFRDASLQGINALEFPYVEFGGTCEALEEEADVFRDGARDTASMTHVRSVGGGVRDFKTQE
jgi:hypothetical protein